MNRQELEALIRQTAVREGVPPELFMRVIGAESSFNHGSIGEKGERGLAQLMPDTAKELGVDPSDIGQNLTGGARYLRQQIDRFGSYPLALAAYNAGPSKVARAGNKIPNISTTQDYVNKIMEGLTLSPLSATRRDDEQPYLPALYQPQQPQQRGLMGFLSGLGQPSQTTGLNFMNKLGMAAATLNPMNPMSGEYIKSMQIRGQQALAAKGRNQTIEMLKRKAQQGDAVAGQIAAGIESGGISAKDGMAAYYKYTLTPTNESTKIENYKYALNVLGMTHEEALKFAASGGNTNVSIGAEDAEASFWKEHYKTLGREFTEIRSLSAQAGAVNASLNALKELYKVAPHGPLTGRLLEMFPEANDATAAIASLRTQLAPQLRVEGSGSTSDVEYEGMLRSLGTLRNSPLANQAVLDIMMVKNDISQEKGRIVQKVGLPKEQGGLTIKEAMAALDNIDLEMWRKSNIVKNVEKIIVEAGGTIERADGTTITTSEGLEVSFQ